MSSKNFPKVSIIMPVYNGSKYVKEAIDSALSQTYKNIEIIVVNDGSTDDGKTDKILLSYGDKIKYYKKENGGVSTALNMAINNSNGEYISWLSHDDVYYPDKIEKQIKYLIDNKKLNQNIILYGDYDLIDYKSRLITECKKDHELLIKKPEYFLLRGNINGITLLIPKKAFDDCGLFDEKLRCTQDYELWMRMQKKYKFEHMEGIVAKSRQHKEQVTYTNPKVITEGNKLWTDMIESCSKEVMKRLEGSEYNFYSEMKKFLIDTPYDETRVFCEKKCKEIENKTIKETDKKLVSVIIPFYNRIELVEKALKSVINQTHKNLEIILVNDGSKESFSVLKKIEKSDDRIKIINIKENKGAANARNVGIDNAKGEYIAFLDSDDLFVKDKVEKQLFSMLLRDSKVSHTSYLRRGLDEETIINSGTLDGKAVPRIIYNCGIATPTVMIKASYLEENSFRYNPKLIIGEDTCFWLEILRKENILGIDEALTIVNVNGNSAAYNLDKQIIGLKTIITYVLNDVEYKDYDYEIAMLCHSYINYVNQQKNSNINNENVYCANCLAMENSKSWRVTKPLRDISKIIQTVKKHGFLITIKKIVNRLKNR